MAASDYSQIVFDKNGKTVPSCQFKIGDLSIEAYKTWLYIKSKKFWTKESGYSEPHIGQFTEGGVTIFGITFKGKFVDLKNKEGMDYGNVMVWSVSKGYGDDEEIYAGVCCYAHMNCTRFLARKFGVPDDWDVNSSSSSHNPKTGKYSDKWFRSIDCYPPDHPHIDASDKEWDKYRKKVKTFGVNKYSKLYEDSYCGITQDMIDALVKSLKDDYNNDLAKKIAANKKASYSNQGDRNYFGGPETKVGEVTTPVFHEMIKGLTPDKNSI